MEITQVKHAGFNWNVRLPVPWHDINIVTDVIDKDEYGLIELRQGIGDSVKSILDVGGHIGSFGVLAKSLWPDALLIAVEPTKDNCDLYFKNLKDNGLDKDCFIIQAAIGYDPTCNCLVHSPSTTGGNIMRQRAEAEAYIKNGYRFYNRIEDYNVTVLTIEEIFEDFGIERIDLAKWDCEGGEIDAFQKMSMEAAAKFRFMVGEYHVWKVPEYMTELSEDEKEYLLKVPYGYLKAPLFENRRFWRNTRRKFPHLNFDYPGDYKRIGLFQAWPNQVRELTTNNRFTISHRV